MGINNPQVLGIFITKRNNQYWKDRVDKCYFYCNILIESFVHGLRFQSPFIYNLDEKMRKCVDISKRKVKEEKLKPTTM